MTELSIFHRSYLVQIQEGLTSVNLAEVNRAIQRLSLTAGQGGGIYVGGNGGSSAIANHLTCDFLKGCDHEKYRPLRAFSLSSNAPLLTAISNDISYDKSLSYQLERLALGGADTVILISSSGNSPNIIEAANVCKDLAIPLIGMTGFDGGKLNDMADIKIHVPIKNYGVVEDCHQAIMHIMSQYIAKERAKPCP